MAKIQTGFSQIFEAAYRGEPLLDSIVNKSFAAEMQLQELPGGMGHPDYEHLRLGESLLGDAVIFFYDMRGCTKLSIALPSDELQRILDALTKASIISVKNYGGYVGEFTGDGIMAYFGGPSIPPETAVFNALRAASFLMEGIKDIANRHLNRQGDETAKVGMGIEFGEIRWARIGTAEVNQVKPIAAAAFVAGKASSKAKAWECLVGQDLQRFVDGSYLSPSDENIEFQYDNKKYMHGLSLFNWERFFTEFCEDPARLIKLSKGGKLGGLGIAAIPGTGVSSLLPITGISQPKQLKDRPFFGE